ncbi:MAG: MFS transporter, partial [Nocardioidaceae bacterium]
APGEGGVGLSFAGALPMLVAFNAVGVVAYIAFGFLSDAWGRKKASIPCALISVIFGFLVVLAQGQQPALAIGIAGVGAFTAFFGIYGVWISESFPTRVRAWALGLIFNTGRVVGGLAPIAIGALAASWGLGPAMLIGIPGFVVFAIAAAFLRETRAVALD